VLLSSPSGGSSGSIYFVLAILVLLLVRRTFRVMRGSRVSRGRTLVFTAWYFAFAGILIGISYAAGGVGPTDLALYLLVGAVGLFVSDKLSDRRIGFWKGADGQIYYRGAVIIYIVYIVALIARLSIDLIYIGPQAFNFDFSSTVVPSATAVNAGIVTDVLLCLGAGMIIGRNIRVLKRLSLIQAGKEQVTDEPPKISFL
jgi:hypothetical protein